MQKKVLEHFLKGKNIIYILKLYIIITIHNMLYLLFYRPVPTKLDYAVYNAVSTLLNPITYPNIYRWQHDMQLAMKRDLHRYQSLLYL